MNYQLTSDSIIIEGREPIDRKVFEKWLLDHAAIDKEEVRRFWDCRIECYQPESAIQEFIDHQTAFTEFDGIKKGIDRICK